MDRAPQREVRTAQGRSGPRRDQDWNPGYLIFKWDNQLGPATGVTTGSAVFDADPVACPLSMPLGEPSRAATVIGPARKSAETTDSVRHDVPNPNRAAYSAPGAGAAVPASVSDADQQRGCQAVRTNSGGRVGAALTVGAAWRTCSRKRRLNRSRYPGMPQKRKAMPARRGPRTAISAASSPVMINRQSTNASRRRWSGMRAPAP